MLGGYEWMIIGGIGLMLFGKRFASLGRSLGQTIFELRKGAREVIDE